MSELGKTLQVVQLLNGADLSAVELCQALGVSVATLKRYVADARHMGARIESYGGGRNPWFYRLNNWEQIAARVGVWVVLESSRDLTGPI